MEENYQGYNQPEYENDDPRKGANKSILGYRIVIIILAVILAAITVLYYNIHRQQQADYDLLVIDRDSIQNNLSDLMQDFDDLQLSNDTLSLQMGIERQRADSLMQRLKQERSWSLAKIKQYEKEVGTLRTIMRGYLHQIDSLNTLNKKADRRKTYPTARRSPRPRCVPRWPKRRPRSSTTKYARDRLSTPGVSAW